MYNARQLLSMTEDQLWGLPKGPMSLQFDDGVLETNYKDTICSWYLWDYCRQYPKTPLLIEHHIGNKRMKTGTTLNILGKQMRACWDAYSGQVERELLWKIAQECTNNYFNRITYKLEANVSTVSILDYIEIMEHPVIATVNANLKPLRASIENAYKVISEVILDPENFNGNAVAEAAKAGLVSMGQVLQCVGPRGLPTDVDSTVFKKPILTGFVAGLTTLADSLMESRSASKSLALTKDPLQDSEYFSRQVQLGGMTLRNLNFHDCGSETYHEFLVHDRDLANIEGKYYRTESGLAVVPPNAKHLLGKTLKLRSALHCHDADPYGVCSTCFGELAYSLPNGTNLGWADVVELAKDVTQILLSNKHLDLSAGVDDITLSDHERLYMLTVPDSNHVWGAKRLHTKQVRIVLSAKETTGLGDISHTNDVTTLAVQNITALNDVAFIVVENGTETRTVLNVAVGKRLAALTHEMLMYLKHRGWTLTPEGDCEIDLQYWNWESPLFELPLRHINMVDYANDLSSVLIGGGKEKGTSMKTVDGLRSLRSYDNPDDALLAVYNLVSIKLNVPLVHLECILLALSSRDPNNHDYRLPRAGEPIYFGSFTNTMARRSLSGLLAWQGQRAHLHDPVTFLIDNRPSHPKDDLILP